MTTAERAEQRIDTDDLLATISTLAAIDRAPTSPGERQAAEWLARRLADLGCEVEIEDAVAFSGFARTIAGLSAGAAAAGVLAALGARRTGAAAATLAAALVAEDISNGPRLARRVLQHRRATQNVVAVTGDASAGRTIVLLAHHDAAPTGAIFDQTLHTKLHERFPAWVERTDTALPIWWPVVGAPGLVAAGALARRRGAALAGAGLAAAAAAAVADIARSPHVPGASDNLTAVACLVAVAAALRRRPVEGVRVLLVSCGAEETLQGGIRTFAERHFAGWRRDRTAFLNLETLGGPRLCLVEGEGPLVMEDYADPSFRELVVACAERAGIPLRRNMRARSSTDSVIPSRAGFPTATLVSVDHKKALAHYHLMSDTPENVDLRTVARAAALAEDVVRAWAAGPQSALRS